MPETRTLAHLTLNTGHTRPSPRAEVGDETIALLAPLLATGKYQLPAPFDGYRLVMARVAGERSAAFSVFKGDGSDEGVPLATCFVCWDTAIAERQWAGIGATLGTLAEGFPRGALPSRMPRRPRETPWLAVLVWPTALRDATALGWLGDFERCVAWALIERGSGPRSDSTEKG